MAVNYPGSRHGIFRFFDLWDPSDDRVRLQPIAKVQVAPTVSF